MTVAVVNSCTRNSTETVLLRPRNVSVKIPVQNVATATVTLQSRWTHGIRNVQIELKSAVCARYTVECTIGPRARSPMKGNLALNVYLSTCFTVEICDLLACCARSLYQALLYRSSNLTTDLFVNLLHSLQPQYKAAYTGLETATLKCSGREL